MARSEYAICYAATRAIRCVTRVERGDAERSAQLILRERRERDDYVDSSSVERAYER